MVALPFLSKLLNGLKLQLALLIFFSVTFLAISSLFTYLYFAKDLKSKESIMNRNSTGIILYDRNDKAFFTFYEARSKILKFAEDRKRRENAQKYWESVKRTMLV